MAIPNSLPLQVPGVDLSIPTKIPSQLYNILFEWMPVVSESCSKGPCAIPANGVALYAVIGIGGYLLVSRALEYLEGDGSDTDEFEDPAKKMDLGDDDGESDEPDIPNPFKEALVNRAVDTPRNEYKVGGEAVTPDFGADIDPGEAGDPGDSVDDEMSEDMTTLDTAGELETRSIAPNGVSREFYSARVGSKHRRVLFAEEWPEQLEPNPLVDVFNDPTLGFDMSIHFKPKNRRRAIREAEKKADSLRAQASVQTDSGGSGSRYAANDNIRQAEAMERVREAMKDGSQPFDTSLYVSIRTDDEEQLDSVENDLVSKMKDNPAGITLSTIRGRPLKGLQSVSPLAQDTFANETEVDTDTVLLSGGVSSLLASMSVSGELDPGGIEIGEHVTNGMPLIRDPFDSETNYNQVIIGDSGAGKSYNIKLQAIREAASTDNRMIIMLDPLEGFHGLAAALDAEHIPVGGERGFNPLEIERPTDKAIAEAEGEFNQLKTKVKSVLNFFENYFHTQGLEGGLGQKKVVLNEAIYQTYYDAGITKDPTTHGKPSPTILDVRENLEKIAQDGSLLDPATEDEKEAIEAAAGEVHTMLRPFVSGEYENLGKKSEIDIQGNDFIYVDLSPQESSEGGGSGLMMQLLFQILYEQAKTTPKEVIFIIDEAQFMLKEGQSLEFLSQRVRHARHFDMSIRFATQNVKDFMRTDKASDIINNAYLTTYHRTNEIFDFVDQLDISPAHASFIEDAASGENYDYSQALYQINNEFYPAKITSLPSEDAVVSYEPGQGRETLPGITDDGDSRLVKGIRHRIESYVEDSPYDATHRGPSIPGETLKNSARTLSETERAALEFIGWENMVHAVERINDGEEPKEVLSEFIDKKFDEMVDTLGEEQIMKTLEQRRSGGNTDEATSGRSQSEGTQAVQQTDDD